MLLADRVVERRISPSVHRRRVRLELADEALDDLEEASDAAKWIAVRLS